MKKYLLFLLLLPSMFRGACANEYTISHPFNGIVDKSPKDLIGNGFAVDAMNILTDEYDGAITRRKGMVSYLNTPYPGLRPIRKLYEYIQTSGSRYMIIVSSTSISYSSGDGNRTSIVNNLAETWDWSFATINNELYANCNSTTPWKWDGTTLTWIDINNSTGMVSGKHTVFWKNRWFISGVDSALSTIYYSRDLDPLNLYTSGTQNTINVNVSDGDSITGLHITDNDTLFCTKNYSIYEITQIYDDEFIPRLISKTYGCLYGSTLSNYLDSPVWVSARGVETYNGNITNISRPIEHQFQSLQQLNAGELSVYYDSAQDWGNGVSVSIDTTSTLGSVLMQDTTDVLIAATTVYQTTQYDWDAGTISSRQITGYPYTLNMFHLDTTANGDVKLNGGGTDKALSGGTAASKEDASHLSGAAIDNVDSTYWFPGIGTTGDVWWAVNLGSQMTVYKIAWAGNTQIGTSPTVYLQSSTDNTNWTTLTTSTGSRETKWNQYDSETGVSCRWLRLYYTVSSGYNQPQIYTFSAYQYASTGSIITQSLDFGSPPTTYNMLVAGISTTSATAILFETRSSTDNINWSDWLSIENNGNSGGGVNSPARQYLMCKAILSSTTSLKTPILSSVTISCPEVSQTASFTTDFSTASNWGSWGIFRPNYSAPSGSKIDFHIQTSTANDNWPTRPYVSASYGGPVNSTVGEYIKVTSSFTRTLNTLQPAISNISISYRSTNFIPMQGITYEDRYYVGVSTSPVDKINDLIYVFDTNVNCVKFTGNMGSACIYNNQLYIGDSRNTGKIFRAYSDDIYTDDGQVYESYYVTSILDLGEPYKEKTFSHMWIATDNEEAGTINIDYRLDGSTGTWTSKSLNLYNDYYGLVKTKIPFEAFPKSYYIQFRFYTNNSYNFIFKLLNLQFNVEPER